jgi:hypothetical protein
VARRHYLAVLAGNTAREMKWRYSLARTSKSLRIFSDMVMAASH